MPEQNYDYVICGANSCTPVNDATNSNTGTIFSASCNPNGIYKKILSDLMITTDSNAYSQPNPHIKCIDAINKGVITDQGNNQGAMCFDSTQTEHEKGGIYELLSNCSISGAGHNKSSGGWRVDSTNNCPNGYTDTKMYLQYNGSSSNDYFKICKRQVTLDNGDCCDKPNSDDQLQKCPTNKYYSAKFGRSSSCNDYMNAGCKDPNNLVGSLCTNINNNGGGDFSYCTEWQGTNKCRSSINNYCKDNITSEFCKSMCSTTTDPDIKNNCNNAKLNYCKTKNANSSIKFINDVLGLNYGDDGTFNNIFNDKICRSFCTQGHGKLPADLQGECDILAQKYCKNNNTADIKNDIGSSGNQFCSCLYPLTNYSEYPGLVPECNDATCTGKGYKTHSMLDASVNCPQCVQIMQVGKITKSDVNLSQNLVCDPKTNTVSSVPIDNNKPVSSTNPPANNASSTNPPATTSPQNQALRTTANDKDRPASTLAQAATPPTPLSNSTPPINNTQNNTQNKSTGPITTTIPITKPSTSKTNKTDDIDYTALYIILGIIGGIILILCGYFLFRRTRNRRLRRPLHSYNSSQYNSINNKNISNI